MVLRFESSNMLHYGDKVASVVVALAKHKAIRLGDHSWRWAEKWDGRPSLANPMVAPLFRYDFVTEENRELKLTAAGQILAELLEKVN